jgi:hypothetical protein
MSAVGGGEQGRERVSRKQQKSALLERGVVLLQTRRNSWGKPSREAVDMEESQRDMLRLYRRMDVVGMGRRGRR